MLPFLFELISNLFYAKFFCFTLCVTLEFFSPARSLDEARRWKISSLRCSSKRRKNNAGAELDDVDGSEGELNLWASEEEFVKLNDVICVKWTIYEWKRSEVDEEEAKWALVKGISSKSTSTNERTGVRWRNEEKWHERKFIQARKLSNFPNWLRAMISCLTESSIHQVVSVDPPYYTEYFYVTVINLQFLSWVRA